MIEQAGNFGLNFGKLIESQMGIDDGDHFASASVLVNECASFALMDGFAGFEDAFAFEHHRQDEAGSFVPRFTQRDQSPQKLLGIFLFDRIDNRHRFFIMPLPLREAGGFVCENGRLIFGPATGTKIHSQIIFFCRHEQRVACLFVFEFLLAALAGVGAGLDVPVVRCHVVLSCAHYCAANREGNFIPFQFGRYGFDKSVSGKQTLPMYSRVIRILFVALCCVSVNVPSAGAAPSVPTLALKPAWTHIKFKRPLWLEESPDGTGRIFMVEQAGRILIMPKDRAATNTVEFLDISARKTYRQDEEGLLGMAFHPKYKENGRLFLFYSAHDPLRSIISEWRVSKDNPSRVDLASERVLLEIPRPFWNHDGGVLMFGKDGYLYLSHGDGGQRDDPHDNGQNLGSLLGKILRIDVDNKTGNLPYGIPKDNPFIGTAGARPEIWAFGLRNVWRMAFDRKNGDLWASDVGQDKWEEINVITKGGNYGWRVREGFHPWKDSAHKHTRFIDPVLEYPHVPALAKESKSPEHGTGVSITGGYVYRGNKLPVLQGVYVYADYKMGTVWGLRSSNNTSVDVVGEIIKPNPIRFVASFGEDAAGELYMLCLDGNVYEFVMPAPKPGRN